MPDSQLYTLEAATTKAAAIKAALALSKLRFYQSSLVPTPATTRAQLVNAECTFDGYPAGGYALAAWTGPGNAAGGGAVITSPLILVAYGPAADPPITNTLGGWWIDDATNNVRLVGKFNPARDMIQVGNAFWLAIQDVEGFNLVPGA